MNKLVLVCVAIVVIASILGLVAFIMMMMRNAASEKYTNSTIPIYITSLNDPVSKKRSATQRQALGKYGINKYKYNPGLHWKRDAGKISSTFPNLNKASPHFVKRPGAYGLTASFLQFLKTAHKNKHKLVAWMEDDVIPAGSETIGATGATKGDKKSQLGADKHKQIIVNFQNEYKAALRNLPVHNNDVYFFGHTSYCEPTPTSVTSGDSFVRIARDAKYKAGGPGTSFIIFSNDAVVAIQQWVRKNDIDLPIDMLFMKFIRDEVITGWEVNRSITHNHMFYGLFEQIDTYCDHRKNNTIDN